MIAETCPEDHGEAEHMPRVSSGRCLNVKWLQCAGNMLIFSYYRTCSWCSKWITVSLLGHQHLPNTTNMFVPLRCIIYFSHVLSSRGTGHPYLMVEPVMNCLLLGVDHMKICRCGPRGKSTRKASPVAKMTPSPTKQPRGLVYKHVLI